MAFETKTNLPNATDVVLPNTTNQTGEYNKYVELQLLTTRTNSGNFSWTSPTSGILYTDSGETDGTVLNKGETGLMNLIARECKSWMLTADDINVLISAVEDLQTDKADKATSTNMTISTNWTGASAPYTQTFSLSGVTSASMIKITVPATNSDEQNLAFAALQLFPSTQTTNQFVLKAYGIKNTINIPIIVVVGGE